MKLGFMGDQKVEIHLNKDNGEIIELLVNGQKQEAPDTSQTEIVESRRERVTVPKGEFDSVYVKMHDRKENKDMEPGSIPPWFRWVECSNKRLPAPWAKSLLS